VQLGMSYTLKIKKSLFSINRGSEGDYPLKAYWLRHEPTGFTFKNFTFSHTVFMCFEFISEENSNFFPIQPALIGFYNRDKSVYCAVRTGSLNKAV